MTAYQAYLLSGAGQTEAVRLEKPQPAAGQVLVKVAYCAICTLEQRIFQGVMQRYPFAGGHEVAGVVEAAGARVKTLRPGDKVAARLLNACGECYYCRNGHENLCVASFLAETQPGYNGPGGFAEYALLDAASLYLLPPAADLRQAALCEPLACCVHSVRRAKIGLADDVVIIGAGVMGALHIKLAKLCGARVIACELDAARLALARRMGADILCNTAEEDAAQAVQALTEGRGADVVVCAAAAPEAAALAVRLAGKLGRVVFYSSFHPDAPVALSPSKLHSGEQIITGAVNPQRRDFLTAARLLSFGLVDTAALITDVLPLRELGRALSRAVAPDSLRVLVEA